MDENKEVEEIKGRDLGSMERAKAPKKTWFFKRLGDGLIFPCEEKEAWDIVYNRSEWKRHDFQLLGTSTGKTYQRIIRESMMNARKLEPEIEAMKAELKKYQQAEERLVLNEVVDMEGDPSDTFNEANKQKVLRLRKIMDRINDQLDAKEEEYRKLIKDVVKTATDAELAVAQANQAKRLAKGKKLDWPSRQANVQTPDATQEDREEILNLMKGRK